jgi:hypothetical protein
MAGVQLAQSMPSSWNALRWGKHAHIQEVMGRHSVSTLHSTRPALTCRNQLGDRPCAGRPARRLPR